jgi:hypothetical protein
MLIDKSVTVHNTRKCSKIPPSASMHHAARVRRSRVARRSLLFFAGNSIQNASDQFVSCIRLSYYKFRSASNPTNKNQTELGMGIETVLSR